MGAGRVWTTSRLFPCWQRSKVGWVTLLQLCAIGLEGPGPGAGWPLGLIGSTLRFPWCALFRRGALQKSD